MRLLDALRGRPSTVERSLTSQVDLWQQSWFGRDDIERSPATFETYVNEGYKANGIVFSVMLARTLTFAQAEFKFQNLADRSLFGNPDLAILEEPWPNGSTGELLARMDQDVCLSGNFYAVKRDDGYLERLRPDWVTIALDDETYRIAGYVYVEGGYPDDPDDVQVFTPDQVAHWSPIPDPIARHRGMSPLTAIAREVDADTRFTDYKSKFLDNAATPNLLLKYPSRLTEDIIDRLRQRMDVRHGGDSNAFKTMILDSGADATIIGSTFEQMNLRAVQGAGETRIAAAFGVPPVIVGLSEGLAAATYSNYELAMRRFADLTMTPLWMSASVALSKLVTVPAGARLWYDTTHMPALRQTEKDRAETMQVFSLAAGELIRVGYDPMTVAKALVAGDASILTHTGAIPTALYPDGKAPESPRSEPMIADGAIRVDVHPPGIEVDARTMPGAINASSSNNPAEQTAAAVEAAVNSAVDESVRASTLPLIEVFELMVERDAARADEMSRMASEIRASGERNAAALEQLGQRRRTVKRIERDAAGEISAVIEEEL